MSPASHGRIARVANQFVAEISDEQSGFLLLNENKQALNWRLALVDNAVRSIDAQYYIWEDDETGNLLLRRLLSAAKRGVRVRLLVDDFPLAAKSRDLALLNQHPNFELRVYNPGYVRDNLLGGMVEFVVDMEILNQRMHNKLFIVDGQIAILGGRNIGNPYFGLSKKYNFRDLDVMVVGEVLPDLSRAFDQYWNSEGAYPTEAMVELRSADYSEEVEDSIDAFLEKKRQLLSSYSIQPRQWEDQITSLENLLQVGYADYIQDSPIGEQGVSRLVDKIEFGPYEIKNEVIIISPYLIPDEGLLETVDELSENDVRVRILTNSLGSNNHTIAHSHYRKYRKRILETGAVLNEFRHDPSQSVRNLVDVSPVRAEFVSLHAKVIVADQVLCYVGSLNLDPRGRELNTENGLIIMSEPFVAELSDILNEMFEPANSWRVYLNEEGWLRWGGEEKVLDSQPARGTWQRIKDFFYRLLPVESQL